MGLKEPKTATIMWISTLLTAVFCGIQLASSSGSAVPGIPLGLSRGATCEIFAKCRVYLHKSLRGLKLCLVHLAVGDSC